jgi:3'(2'), 5'-bisphosphate nucleotidase
MVGRSHLGAQIEAFLKGLPGVAHAWGSSLKFARICERGASLYARLAQTSEWDVAAGHAILAAADGIVTMPDGPELTPDFPCPRFCSLG